MSKKRKSETSKSSAAELARLRQEHEEYLRKEDLFMDFSRVDATMEEKEKDLLEQKKLNLNLTKLKK